MKQGCPLSGTLFALAVDPLLRRLGEGGGPLTRKVFACASDLAIVLRTLIGGLSRLPPIFTAWAVVSGLRLRLDKSVVVPLCGRDLSVVSSDLASVGGGAEAMGGQRQRSVLGCCPRPRRAARAVGLGRLPVFAQSTGRL